MEPDSGPVSELLVQPESCAETTPPGETTPDPQGRSNGLANTGASVMGTSLAGLVALLLGAGLIVLSRRRRATT